MPRLTRLVSLLIVGGVLVGCSAPPIIMQDARTGATTECGGIGFSSALVQRVAEECARAYEKAGWARISS
jgi:hypothetical protein